MKVFISGAYRADYPSGIFANIIKARDMAIDVWKRGHWAYCPHLNSALMDGIVPDSQFLAADIALLGWCDCMLMVPGWEESAGAGDEVAYAKHNNIPIFFSIESLPPENGTP